MILTVSHISHYTYDAPVRGVVQSHRLTPSVYEGQRTRAWQVSVSGGLRGGGFRDGAGDWVQSYSVPGPVSEITVMVQGTVETIDTAGILRGHRESVRPEAYLDETPQTRIDAALTELGATAAEGAKDPLDRAHRLMAAVADAIAYRPGVTLAHTTAAEALAQGEGVCQDHAHAMIAVARSLGIPARYVTGYLLATDSDEAQEAAHAWAELHIDRYGWIGFDAANRSCPDVRYIRLASGADARDAAPIRGIARGPGAEAESLDVTVMVQAQQ